MFALVFIVSAGGLGVLPTLATPIPTNLNVVAWGDLLPEGELSQYRSLAQSAQSVIVGIRHNNTIATVVPRNFTVSEAVPLLSDVREVAVGEGLAVLFNDGRVLLTDSLTNEVSDRNWVNLPWPITNGVAVAAVAQHAIVLTEDGRIFGSGYHINGECLPPAAANFARKIATSQAFSAALRSDGRLVGWGFPSHGVQYYGKAPNNVLDFALSIDTTFVLTGDHELYGLDHLHTEPFLVATNVSQISASTPTCLALLADGNVISTHPMLPPPSWLKDVKFVYAAQQTFLAFVDYPLIKLETGEAWHGDQRSSVGSRLTLRAAFPQDPDARFEWRKDGKPIVGATDRTLVLGPLSVADSGVYTLLANGRSISPETRLTVGLAVIEQQPADFQGEENTPITLQVQATSDRPLTYQWLINGRLLSEWNAQTQIFPPESLPNGPSFVFPPTAVSMSGDYQVVVVNDAGSVTSEVARVEIVPGPQIGPSQPQTGLTVRLRDTDLTWRIAQTFRPVADGRLSRVELDGYLPEGSASDPARVELVELKTDLQSAEILATTKLIPMQERLIAAFEGDDVFLDSDKTYAFVIDTASPVLPTSGYIFRTAGGDVYSYGALYAQKQRGGSWQPLEDDIKFRVLSWPGHPLVRVAPVSKDDRVEASEAAKVEVVLAKEVQTVVSVTLLINGSVASVASVAPYAFDWANQAPGLYEVSARVQLADGSLIESRPRTVTVLADRPTNDDFSNSLSLTGLRAESPYRLAGATLEGDEQVPVSPTERGSVWWSWVATKAGWVTVTSEPRSEDLEIGIWRGGSIQSLLLLTNRSGSVEFEAANNGVYSISLHSRGHGAYEGRLQLGMNGVELTSPSQDAVFTAPARLTAIATRTISSLVVTNINLVVDGIVLATKSGFPANLVVTIPQPGPHRLYTLAWDSTGMVTKSKEVRITVRPQNDAFENAITVAGPDFSTNASIVSGTYQIGEPRFGDNEGGHSIWYRWTCPLDGIGRLRGESSLGFEVMLNAFEGQTLSGLALIGANTVNSIVSESIFPVQKGTNYLIRVDSKWGEEGELTWGLTVHPREDLFSFRAKTTGSPLSLFLPTDALSVEDFEQALTSPEVKQTAWFNWRAKQTGPVHVRVSGGTAPLGIGVYQGERISLLQPVVVHRPVGGISSILFQAIAEQSYEIAVFSEEEVAGAPIRVDLVQEGMRILNPLPGSYHALGKPIALQVTLDESQAALTNLVFTANNAPLDGNPAENPQNWLPSQAGQYRIVAHAQTDSGANFESPPVDIVVHADSEIPKPRLFASPNSTVWFFANAVGNVSVLGAQRHWFDLSYQPTPEVPVNVSYHPATPGWEDLVAELGLAGGRSEDRNLVWALGLNGQVYRNGRSLVALPPGVARWGRLVPGFGSVYFIGDNGAAYERGVTQVNLKPDGVRWLGVAPAYLGTYALAEDGRFFVTTLGDFGQSVLTEVKPRGEVNHWVDFRSSATEAVLRGDDGRLYTAGVIVGAIGATQNPAKQGVLIPLPSGVKRFVTYDAGAHHFIALGDDGQAYTWGSNSGGQLGIGPLVSGSTLPRRVVSPAGVTNWLAVAAGADHSIGLGGDCSLYVWGFSPDHTLGALNSIGPVYTPSLVLNTGSQCGEPAVFVEGPGALLPDGSIKLSIPTLLGRRYQVQYSNNLRDWLNAQPIIFGSGSVIEWVDEGPPATLSHPSQNPQRNYRVLFAP